MASEHAVVQAVVDEVRSRGGWVVKTTGVALAGCMDLIGAYRGRALAWEVKQPGGYPRPNQKVQLRLAERAGADARVIRSREEARRALDEIERRAA